MKRILSSESALLIALVLAIMLGANATLGFVLTDQSQAAIKFSLQNRMLDISNTAASMLDGDKLKALKAEDKETPAYQQVIKTLTYFQDNIELEYIYCIQPVGDNKFVFSVDPTVEDPGEFGAPIVYTPALYKASLGTAAVDEEAYSDAWGRFYSAYSPVFGSDGKVAGIVAVDFSAKWYENEIAKQTHTIYTCMGVSSVVCVLLLLLATSRLRSKIRSMTKDLDELVHDVDELSWEMTGMGTPEEIQQTSRHEDANLHNLNQRIKIVKEGLRHYWENSNSRANVIITSLASDYRTVLYLNLDTDKGTCYKAVGRECGLVPDLDFAFSETMEKYANTFVATADQDRFLQAMHPEEIRKALSNKNLVTHLYKIRREEIESYMTVCIAAIKHADNQSGFGLHAVGVGFKDVDPETSQALLQKEKPV